MNAIRLAAYKFSTLHRADKRWLLQRLSAEERFKIESALKELKSIKGNAKIEFDELLSSPDMDLLPKAGVPAEEVEQVQLNRLDALTLKKVYAGLSPQFLAAFLSDHTDLKAHYFSQAMTEQSKETAQIMLLKTRPVAPAAKHAMDQIVADLAADTSGIGATTG